MSRSRSRRAAPPARGWRCSPLLVAINVRRRRSSTRSRRARAGRRRPRSGRSQKGLAAWAALAEREGRAGAGAARRALRRATLPGDGTVAVMDSGAVDARRGARAARVRRARRVAWSSGGPALWLWTGYAAGTAAGCPSGRTTGRRPLRVLAGAPESAGVRRVLYRRRRSLEGGNSPDSEGAGGRRGRAAARRARPAAGGSRCSPTARRSRTACSARPTTPRWRSPSSGRGPLTFVESVHGSALRAGSAALPGPLRLGADRARARRARLSWSPAAAASARPSPSAATWPPPRRAYVDVLAATMARGRDREEAVAPVRAEARRLLARRAGLGAAGRPGRMARRGARRRASSRAEAQALSGRATDDETVVAAGRALAALAGGERGGASEVSRTRGAG